MKKGNLKSFVSGERSRALWALLLYILKQKPPISDVSDINVTPWWTTHHSQTICVGYSLYTVKSLLFVGHLILWVGQSTRSQQNWLNLIVVCLIWKKHEFKCPQTCPSSSNHKIACSWNKMISQYYDIVQNKCERAIACKTIILYNIVICELKPAYSLPVHFQSASYMFAC